MIRTRPGSNHVVIGGQLFPLARQFDCVTVEEFSAPMDDWNPIPIVKIRTHANLPRHHPLRMLENLLKAQFSRIAEFTKHRVGIKINYLLHRVTQRLRRDRCPMGATAADFCLVCHNSH